ncbi:hypothetical protein F52700_13378 [Fusarium sp. NRRL 52700]|nr:hypothetical protein F52700_13378 [Fusarium sp. NRRL 52700]
MGDFIDKLVLRFRNRERLEKWILKPLPACEHPSCSSKCRSKQEDGDHSRKKRIDPLPRVPAPLGGNRPSLVSEVKTVYARLVKVEERCNQVEQGQSKNSERNPDLNNQQWEALQALHRTLLGEHHDIPIAFCLLSPQLRHLRKIAHDHSLQSRSLRRFSDCLLPLLKREQDLELARQWLEVMKLSSSLVEILGKNDMLFVYQEEALMETIEEIETILGRLKEWFRRKYEDLGRKKEVTEEQGLVEPIFEFPNNIRHTCTTMPWTIFPALLVLWGVCWMFIIGSSQPEHECRNPVDPMISPAPAAYDFYPNFHDIGIEEGLQGSAADNFDNSGHFSHDSLEELWQGDVQLMNDPIHLLIFAQNTPQDPNFLVPDMRSCGDSESLRLTTQDMVEILPAAAMRDSTLTACTNTDSGAERDTTGSADSSGYGQRTIDSDDRSEETQGRLACPDCPQTFTRPFTLSRHRTEKHKDASSSEESLLCPNTGCKRSNGNPFKPSIQHRQDVGPDEAIRANGMKKRPRAEDDEGSNDEFLLSEMVKKYKKMEQEIEEKQEGLEALGKTIQLLKGLSKNS